MRLKPKNFSTAIAIIIGVGLPLLFASSAGAKKKTPCYGLQKKYCKGVKPKGGRILKCFAKNRQVPYICDG